MSGWRQFAEHVRADGEGDPETRIALAQVDGPFVPIVPNVSMVPNVAPLDPAFALRAWHRHLVALNDHRAPGGFPRLRWKQACDDARWLYENFAGRAVRDGWSAHDLFGVLPWHPGWGGLSDRVKGARNLKMESQRAVWSSWGVPEWFCAGAGDQLVSSGIMLIWELVR